MTFLLGFAAVVTIHETSFSENVNALIERGKKDNEATITFKPDLKEQQRLIDIYTVN